MLHLSEFNINDNLCIYVPGIGDDKEDKNLKFKT